MQVMDELRKQQMAIMGDFKSRSQKAEKILGEIEECENTISSLSESLSAVLLMDVMQTARAAKVPKSKVAKVNTAKLIKVDQTVTAKPVVKTNEAISLKDLVRDFMLKAGEPMKIAEIVQEMQAAGQVFQAKKPIKTITKLMYNNSNVFKRVKPGTFKAV